MAKIPYDKYYTNPKVARWCINKAYEIIGKENISEIIEPSAGCGMFSHQIEGCKAYDLYPQHEYIEQIDFLELDLGGYKKGRLFIGNPPFGASAGKILKNFYNKCCNDGDYIAFILPASYHNNYQKFNKFEIIYSCIIEAEYTNVKLYTSFVIYKRNVHKDKFKNEKEPFLKDVTFTKVGRSNKKGFKHKKHIDHDYVFSVFGIIMKEYKLYETAGQMAVKINNLELKDKIISCLKWMYYYNKRTNIFTKKCVSSPSVNINDVIKVLKICIPEIK